MRFRVALRVLLITSMPCLMLWLGCGGSSSSNSNSNSAQLRVIHGMPQMGAVDVMLDGSSTLFFQALSYEQSTGYQSVTAAQHTVVVVPSGSANTLLSTPFTAASGSSYTIVDSGFSSGVSNLSAVVLTDDLASPGSGNFKIRAVNASPSGGTLDVYITAPGADLTTISPNAANLGFLSASSYLSLAAGSYQIRMTVAGSKTVEIDTGTVGFSAGQIRTVMALDSPGGGSPGALIYFDLN